MKLITRRISSRHADVERSGVAYVLAGDCNQIGDFLTAIRDGGMLALAIDMKLPGNTTA